MKMYCLIPPSYGDDSYFVMAESEAAALDAIFEFVRKESEWLSNRDNFDQHVKSSYEPIRALGPGEVISNANA